MESMIGCAFFSSNMRAPISHSHFQILGVACDNASNNGTMIDFLHGLLLGFQGEKGRIRCFAHVINLVVKAILSTFSKKADAEDTCDHCNDTTAHRDDGDGNDEDDDDDDEGEDDEDDEEDMGDDEEDAAFSEECMAEAAKAAQARLELNEEDLLESRFLLTKAHIPIYFLIPLPCFLILSFVARTLCQTCPFLDSPPQASQESVQSNGNHLPPPATQRGHPLEFYGTDAY